MITRIVDGGFLVGFSGTMPDGDEEMALQYTDDTTTFLRWILIS